MLRISGKKFGYSLVADNIYEKRVLNNYIGRGNNISRSSFSSQYRYFLEPALEFKSQIDYDALNLAFQSVKEVSVPAPFETTKDYEALKQLGLAFDMDSISNFNQNVTRLYKRLNNWLMPLEEVKLTSKYADALQSIEDKYGDGLQNGYDLFDYQKECAALMIAKERLLVAYDMGLGKTLISLIAMTADSRNKRILIVTMSRNMNDWLREIKAIGYENDFTVLENPDDFKSNKTIHICSYEKWATSKIKTLDGKEKTGLSKFKHKRYDACTIDESHYIKNFSTERSQSVVTRINSKRRYALSGTPIEKSTGDIFWQLAWLLKGTKAFIDGGGSVFFGAKDKEILFNKKFRNSNNNTILESKGIQQRSRDLNALWFILDRFMDRKTKADANVQVSVNVPEPRHIRQHLTLTYEESVVYKKILNDFSKWFQRYSQSKVMINGPKMNYIEVMEWLNKLRRAASCVWEFPEYQPPKTELPSKLAYLKKHLEDYLKENKKVLIFTSHKKTAEYLALMLESLFPHKEVAYVHGETAMKYRFHTMNRFQNSNDNLSVLVMTTRTGSESYTLTEAKAVFLYDLEFNAKKMQQCYSRAVRLGQTDVVDIHWLISLNTIDVNMHSNYISNNSAIDQTIDRKQLDKTQLGKEFKTDNQANVMDYEKFASDLLSQGLDKGKIYSA